MTTKERYTRADLGELQKLERAGVLEVLRSFEDQGLDEGQFVLRAATLLAPDRVPGLAAAVAAQDPAAVGAAVVAACARPAATGRPLAAGTPVAEVADQILAHRFTFYDEPHQLPTDIDWDFNPGTAHWSHDLNRFSYLGPLARAWQQTGDARYGRKIVELMLDWVTKCRVERCFRGSPYVWGSYLNNAIHIEVWSCFIPQLASAHVVSPVELLRLLKSIHEQLAYLEIVTAGHEGNWPTIGVRGMLATMANLPVLHDQERFVNYGVASLDAQLAAQVLPDGVQDELTPHYHWVVVNNVLSLADSLQRLGRGLSPQGSQLLRRMLHYQAQTIVPNRSAQVAFNDADSACVPDVTDLLAKVGLAAWEHDADDLGPEVFPYAGVAFLRQRRQAGDLYLAFDAGPYGRSHQHEDGLGFWLFAYGRSLLVDPGRHLYDWSEKSFLGYLQSTAAHSTICVDGQGQHSAGRRDTWIAHEPLDLGWQVQPGDVRARGSYALGYGRDNAIKVTHRREIVFVRERCWVVFDLLEGDGEHLIESRFQFAPGAVTIAGLAAHTQYADSNLWLLPRPSAEGAALTVVSGQQKPKLGWYSPRYALLEPSPTLTLTLRARLPLRIATLLWPYRGNTPPEVFFASDGSTAELRAPELGTVSVRTRL